MSLIIDCRKYDDSGIGTYIRSLIPRVQKLIYPIKIKLLVPEDSKEFAGLFDDEIFLITMHSKPFSLLEQFEYLRILNKGDIFWATSLSHPLLNSGSIIATVHDVAQLALPAKIVGRLTKIFSYMYLYSLRRSALLFFYNSEFTKREFNSYLGPTKAQETVTPLGIEDWWYKRRVPEYNKNDPGPYFICVGNVRPHKNLNILFQAFSTTLNLIPHRLIIVGEHEGFRTSVTNFTGLLDALGDRVRFLGRLSDADLLEYISNADALIFPSLYEGFGLPALEAMATGCPVIASTAGALPEVCGKFAAAYFDPTSIDQLAMAMIEHAKLSQQFRLNLVKLGLEHSKKYNWDKTATLTAGAIMQISKIVNAS